MTSVISSARLRPLARVAAGACIGAAAALLAVPAAHAVPASSARMISWGSPLQTAPTRALSAPVDAAYWQQQVAPRAGQIVTVTLWGRVVTGEPIVLFQDLRPIGGGKLKVISTTQPFKLTATAARQTFRPVNFFVHKGDHVGLATIGVPMRCSPRRLPPRQTASWAPGEI